jgi:hypothetical protein
MKTYDALMAAGMAVWVWTGIAGYGDAFLLLAFLLILTSALHEW